MTVYYNKISSIVLLQNLIFRGGLYRSLVFFVKFIFASKRNIGGDFDFVCYTHNRKSENRIYGISRNNAPPKFFKVSEENFITNFNNKSKVKDLIHRNSQNLIGSDYKHRILKRKEFEDLGYGIKDSIYHGDLSKGNILVKGEKIKLIDNEFEDNYSKNYQNLDYLINSLGEALDLKSITDIDWWYSAANIYYPVTKEEISKVFKRRKNNGCDLATKILES